DEFRVDALRLDAVHAIVDASAYPFVEQLTDAVHAFSHASGRHVHAIAESAANDARVVTESSSGGLGCDAQWSDDFHHALHALLTGERDGYYADFGKVEDLATAYRHGYTYEGRYSRFHRRGHGRSAAGLPTERFVVFAQNHDQIGNRAAGDRLSAIVDVDGLMVAAAAVLCAPFEPLLFMGEEYGETAPFPYFSSHTDAALGEAVRRGRAAEFPQSSGARAVPDPQDDATFRSAVLDRRQREKEPHATLLEWYRKLIGLRRDLPVLGPLDGATTSTEVDEEARSLVVHRRAGGHAAAVVVLTFAAGEADVAVRVALGEHRWQPALDSRVGSAPEALEGGNTVELLRPARSVLVLREAA
ncbi:MAG: maltooligosyltrehalose trehalohydrolase, partial [Actinomycetota bacterium]|nr:maltooligosyltrehalose trehalohydrolase [Actinomycetota bacterium]